ncbi:LysR family transcriptional regulator [Sporomusa sp. KB1]|jgi:DNA-binding transcriptional LysR family regulator|uniref:LysR family transcriptional regulator n=1 Tax=Sporomusa sp. KB1 TaxID=943346 RepID=UPI0011A32E4F|nr:LysR family transcriptional regulator [Sporomusa sp. KB1]TWH47901.1 DNA-binding transcriptional LysR family regulator [Sporomusa sp. KB1]
MNMRQLEYFISVATNLNFTKAAKQLYISQSTLSEQILELEKILGVKLFLRNSHSVQLTASGIAFLKEAKEIINKVDESIQIARQAESAITGSLRIGILDGLEYQFLSKVLKNFRRKYPKVTLNFAIYDLFSLDKLLYQNNLDIGFTMSSPLDKFVELNCKVIYTDTFYMALPEHNPINETQLKFFNLDRETFYFESSGRSRDHLIRICSHRLGIAPKIKITHRVDLMLLNVESGTGVAIYPRIILENKSKDGLNYIHLEGEEDYPDSYANLIAIWKKGNTNPCISLLIEEVESITKWTESGSNSAAPISNNKPKK